VRHVAAGGAKAVSPIRAARHLHLAGVIAYDRLSRGLVSSLNLFSLDTAARHELRLASTQGLEPAWSPDSREIAFGGTGATPNTNIYVADRNGKNIRVLTHLRQGATQPVWSPDGRTIAFEAGGGIELVSASGGRIRSLTEGTYPSWNPNGSELVFERHVGSGNGEALFTIRPDGSGLRRVTNLPGEQRSEVWSPDGKEIAFEWWTPSGTGLYLIRPDGTHLRRVTTAALPQGRPAWSPDSRYLAVISDDGLRAGSRILVIDVKSGRVATVATVPSDAADPSWSSH
jgi:Tol biopolymer transport system component